MGTRRPVRPTLTPISIEPGGHLARREFQRQGAARVFTHHAQVSCQAQVVDLDHHPIRLESQRIPPFHPGFTGAQHRLKVRAVFDQVFRNRETQILQVIQQVPLFAWHAAFGGYDGIGEQGQRAGGGQVGIELAQRAGSRIARVLVGRFALFFQPLVEFFEILDHHEGFAAHDEVLRRGGPFGVHRDAQGDGAQGAQVGGDIFAHFAIAARGALHEHPIPVMQHDGQAVDFRLGDETGLLNALIQARQPVDTRLSRRPG